MDDDVILKTKASGNPWRLFEDFLRRIVLAVGAVDTNRNHFVQRTLKARKLQGCSLNGTQEYIPAVHYDAAVNAFHYQAVEYSQTSQQGPSEEQRDSQQQRNWLDRIIIPISSIHWQPPESNTSDL